MDPGIFRGAGGLQRERAIPRRSLPEESLEPLPGLVRGLLAELFRVRLGLLLALGRWRLVPGVARSGQSAAQDAARGLADVRLPEDSLQGACAGELGNGERSRLDVQSGDLRRPGRPTEAERHRDRL